MKRLYRGFTLAEVLITLAVIGVIAAMALPSLIQKIDDIQKQKALKKVYAVIGNATKLVIDANGGTLKGLIGITSSVNLMNLYTPYLQVSKTCNSWPRGICWPNQFYMLSGVEDTPAYPTYGSKSAVILNDGSMVEFIDYNHVAGGCPFDSGVACSEIVVDVNGFKGPNKYGEDMYFLVLFEDRILPSGYNVTDFSSCKNKTGHGATCAAYFLKES